MVGQCLFLGDRNIVSLGDGPSNGIGISCCDGPHLGGDRENVTSKLGGTERALGFRAQDTITAIGVVAAAWAGGHGEANEGRNDVILAFATSQELFPDDFLTDIYLRFCIIYLAHISFFVCAAKSESSVRGVQGSQSLYRGYKHLFNPREIYPTWESPDTLAKSTAVLGEKKASKWLALILRVTVLCCKVVAISFYYEYFNTIVASYLRPTAADFTPEKVSIIRRSLSMLLVSDSDANTVLIAREWTIRLWNTLDTHISELFWLSAYHDAFAIFFSGILGLDSLEEWPPIFGSISHATTMRGFWAHFWHRLVYRSFSYYSKLLLKILTTWFDGCSGYLMQQSLHGGAVVTRMDSWRS
ncbi:hypothetical protein BX600DRAFT_556260 [Xylariales sp. PMI_506]|nr:hypothetical protein BX600DRAFT_556260 [Xylariales sp. PMI_506]